MKKPIIKLSKKMKWSKIERELDERMERLSDQHFFEFYNKFYNKYKLDFDLMTPPYVSDEKLMGAIAILTDVTHKKILEELKKIEKKHKK